MALAFYPIENRNLLESFQQRLSPFLIAVSKALDYTGVFLEPFAGRPSIVDKIISTLPNATDHTPFMTEFYNYIGSFENNTLKAEYDNLIAINLKYDFCKAYKIKFQKVI